VSTFLKDFIYLFVYLQSESWGEGEGERASQADSSLSIKPDTGGGGVGECQHLALLALPPAKTQVARKSSNIRVDSDAEQLKTELVSTQLCWESFATDGHLWLLSLNWAALPKTIYVLCGAQ